MNWRIGELGKLGYLHQRELGELGYWVIG